MRKLPESRKKSGGVEKKRSVGGGNSRYLCLSRLHQCHQYL
jgi:hypothetical protein